MPIMMEATAAGSIVGTLPAPDGLRAEITTPPGTDTTGVPGGGVVVGWVLVADPDAVGGARVEPVFLAAGRAWTPDQYRATYGQTLGVQVGRVP